MEELLRDQIDFKYKAINRNKQIVCISTHYWDDPWFRKQHFMSRFHKEGYKIAYIEPSFSMVKKANISKKKYATNRFFATTVEEINKNLFIIKPPRYLPFWTRPFVSKLTFLYISYRIQSALKKIGFKDYILWIYRPEFANGLKIFNYKKLVFDITDDLAAYSGKNRNKYVYIKVCMDYLVQKSDLTIVTAYTLFEKFKSISSNIHLVPNGYDSNLFAGRSDFSIPSDTKEIPRPIIGFVGTIFSFLDFNLLRYIIHRNKDKSFVFVGNYESAVKEEWLSIVKSYKNIFWLNKKKKEKIPEYINRFDVCLNPFKVDNVSKSVSPLKVFEYLAMKKPVISMKMESLEKERVAAFIYFASTYEDFDKKLNVALMEKGDFKKRLDYEKIKAYSWGNLFRKTSNLIANL